MGKQRMCSGKCRELNLIEKLMEMNSLGMTILETASNIVVPDQ